MIDKSSTLIWNNKSYIEKSFKIIIFYANFSLPSSSDAPTVVTGGSFFSWGTKFRYSGRVEKEILEDIGPLRREEPSINRNFRTSSLRRKASSVPATPSTPIGSELGEISKEAFSKLCKYQPYILSYSIADKPQICVLLTLTKYFLVVVVVVTTFFFGGGRGGGIISFQP